MSSDRCGVQAVICEIVPSTVYVNCALHCLNLIIVHSCQLTPVKSTIDKISKVGIKILCESCRHIVKIFNLSWLFVSTR